MLKTLEETERKSGGLSSENRRLAEVIVLSLFKLTRHCSVVAGRSAEVVLGRDCACVNISRT
jgi:hypothetical protein